MVIAMLAGWLAVMATGAVGLAHAADPSIAKPYSAVLSPSPPDTVAAGARTTITATLTNRTSQQQLGSAEIVAPVALTLVSASTPRGPEVPSGQRVVLRDLSLAPGRAVTVTMTVDAKCDAAGLHTWRFTAKQANDFRGPPGNDLTLDPTESAVTTRVAGSCALQFLTQPRDARTNQVITGKQFDPTGPAVSVEVVDGNGARISTSSASVTVALEANPVEGTLSGTRSMGAKGGVASFPTLQIDRPGSPYKLSATSPGLTDGRSAEFTIADRAVVCLEGEICRGSLPGDKVSIDVTARPDPLDVDSGFLLLSLNTGPRLQCAGYSGLAADTMTVDVAGSARDARTKTVTYRIDRTKMNAVSNNGASFLQMCYGQPLQSFITRDGVYAPGGDYDQGDVFHPGVDLDRDGRFDEYVGLLPDCGPAAAPCITSRRKDGSGDGIIVAEAPRGDPRYRG